MAVDLDLAFASARDVAARVASRELSPVELVDHALGRIDAVQPRVNCFASMWADEARAAARDAADAVAAGRPLGPLHGVPVAVKETTQVEGRPFTLGSLAFADQVADRDAYVTRALRRAGAIVVGTTTSPELAHSLITDSPLHGPTRNPWNLERTTGGSSGGSAAAVASGCVYLAEGSDMGGSVRIPAAWCGVVGLKPGIGRIPMDVLPGLFDSISHHGPLARSVDDARLFLQVTQGPDECDIQSVTTPLDLDGLTAGDVRGLRLGLTVDYGSWWVHPEIDAAIRSAADALRDAGAIVDEIDVHEPLFGVVDELAWVDLWGVFMSAYFGDLLDEWRDRLDPDVVRLMERGRSIDATTYKRIELVRTAAWRRVAAALDGRHALLSPTMAVPPLGAAKSDRVRAPAHDGRYHAPDMTAPWNLVGPCPVLSVPCGRHLGGRHDGEDAGLPIGLQIAGPRWREDVVLRVGRAVELALPAASGTRPPI